MLDVVDGVCLLPTTYDDVRVFLYYITSFQ